MSIRIVLFGKTVFSFFWDRKLVEAEEQYLEFHIPGLTFGIVFRECLCWKKRTLIRFYHKWEIERWEMQTWIYVCNDLIESPVLEYMFPDPYFDEREEDGQAVVKQLLAIAKGAHNFLLMQNDQKI